MAHTILVGRARTTSLCVCCDMSTPAPAGQPDTACMMVEQGCVGEGNNQEAAALLEMQLKEVNNNLYCDISSPCGM